MMIRRLIIVLITGVAGGLTFSSTLLLRQPQDTGLLAVTLQLLFLLGALGVLGMLRPGMAAAALPAPPWVQWPDSRRARRSSPSRWILPWLRVRAALLDAPPPLPAQPMSPQPVASAPPAKPQLRRPRRRQSRSRPAIRLPLPTLDIEFVAAGRRPANQGNQVSAQDAAWQLVDRVVSEMIASPRPEILALHDQPHQLTVQLSMRSLLSGMQQRAVVEGLRSQGISAHWSDMAALSIRRDELPTQPGTGAAAQALLWVPVLRNRQTTIWWPLPRRQHLVLAGDSVAILTGILQRLAQHDHPALPPASPEVLVHDPDSRLRDRAKQADRLRARPDALQQARRLQLQYRFAQERNAAGQPWIPPLCLVVEPTPQTWPDLQPLLDPAGGVQVVLILGQAPPLAALRPLCYQVPVIEVGQGRTPPLPETFRPAQVPIPRPGQVVAWVQGGATWWRGSLPLLAGDEEHR